MRVSITKTKKIISLPTIVLSIEYIFLKENRYILVEIFRIVIIFDFTSG